VRLDHVASWEIYCCPCAVRATRVWFGFALNTPTTFDIFYRLQVTAHFDDVPLLQSAPNRPDYINLFGFWAPSTFVRAAMFG
jgi:hypothetical protein